MTEYNGRSVFRLCAACARSPPAFAPLCSLASAYRCRDSERAYYDVADGIREPKAK